MHARARDWTNPFGDGQSGLRIVDLLVATERRSGAPVAS
jgi:hypothetical protein